MTSFTAKDITLLIDKSAETIMVAVGPHVVYMTIGEWSKMIFNPSVTPRVVSLPLHKGEEYDFS